MYEIRINYMRSFQVEAPQFRLLNWKESVMFHFLGTTSTNMYVSIYVSLHEGANESDTFVPRWYSSLLFA